MVMVFKKLKHILVSWASMGKNIPYKTEEDIAYMRESARISSQTLAVLSVEVKEGITPLYLDKIAETCIRDHGAEPAFLGLYGFPNTLCTSLNEQVVHGIPNDQPLRQGDILSIDCGVKKNGYCSDQAYTFPVGEVSEEVAQLLKVTKECLRRGIEALCAGNYLGDVGYAIQSHAETHNYGVVRDLAGHGLGKSMHEKPSVPNYGQQGNGIRIKNGLVVALEPMINLGTHHVKQLRDGWTIVTADGKPAAHYEHNIAVWEGKPQVLTSFEHIKPPH